MQTVATYVVTSFWVTESIKWGKIRGSVRRRGKNIDSSSKSNPLRRRGKKIMTRRREGVGVDVEKMKKVDELSTKIRVIYLQQ